MSEIVFLSAAEVLEIHQDQIERYGGAAGLRDIGLLKSALAMPAATFGGCFLHENVFEMAAAYLVHICLNHPFMDGNKRTALVAALVFLELNGVSIQDPSGALYELTMEVSQGKTDKRTVAEIFRGLVVLE